jgi:putative hydrolase of the HAD superfamily
LDDFFEKAYYSFEMGMRKPDEHIFHYVLEDAQLVAEETFFIDDSAPNIETAKQIGLKTHLLLAHEKVEAITGYHD